MSNKFIKVFLRLAISIGFLSAVADRFGLWQSAVAAWGNWESFIAYTQSMLPFVPTSMASVFGSIATGFEILFAFALLVGFKTELVAKLSGYLLLLFAVSMIISFGIKAPLDYSVLTASAAAFGLSTMKEKFLELDTIFSKVSVKSS